MPETLLVAVRFLSASIAGLLLLFATSCAVLWREEIVRARAANQRPTGTVFAALSWAFFTAALLIVLH